MYIYYDFVKLYILSLHISTCTCMYTLHVTYYMYVHTTSVFARSDAVGTINFMAEFCAATA